MADTHHLQLTNYLKIKAHIPKYQLYNYDK
jgi:hypothetical protein